MFNHGSSWVPQESIMECRSNLVFSYLLSQEKVKEIIKVEEIDPVSSDDIYLLSDATGDVKDRSYELNISTTQFPSKTDFMLHELLYKTAKPCEYDKCDKHVLNASSLLKKKLLNVKSVVKHFHKSLS